MKELEGYDAKFADWALEIERQYDDWLKMGHPSVTFWDDYIVLFYRTLFTQGLQEIGYRALTYLSRRKGETLFEITKKEKLY